MTDKELMQQALEMIEDARNGSQRKPSERVITALRERLAQSVQEPVAREHITDGSQCWCEPETNYKDPETGISVIVHKEPQ
jgi:hypothetical protein